MIRGWFDHSGGVVRPFVRVDVLFTTPVLVWAPVNFLVDTGATTTYLSAFDAIRAGIPREMLMTPPPDISVERVAGVGGLQSVLSVTATLNFRGTEGQRVVRQTTIKVALLPSSGTPSLLGWDLLQHFALYADLAANRLELHER